jgi:hypothetical protein
VAGGGAIEMELSRELRQASRAIYGKQQLLVSAYAKALEVIPRQVAENAGLDATDILNKLRQKHAQGSTWHGVDVNEGDVCDTYESFVWEVGRTPQRDATARPDPTVHAHAHAHRTAHRARPRRRSRARTRLRPCRVAPPPHPPPSLPPSLPSHRPP